MTSPGRIAGGLLWGVTATATSGWAAGYVNTDPSAPLCCAGAPLILRWNGVTWSRVSAAALGNGWRSPGPEGTGGRSAPATPRR